MSVVHVFEYDGHVEVWLDTEVAEQDGICIGTAATRDQAVADAVKDLEAALEVLQSPREEE